MLTLVRRRLRALQIENKVGREAGDAMSAELTKENSAPARLSQTWDSSDDGETPDGETPRPDFRRSSHTWPKLTREEWRSIANLEISFTMPIDEEGHRHLHLELRQRRAKRVFLRIDVRVRTLLMWLLLLLSIGSASALRVGAAVRPPAGFHKPHQPARTISSAPRHGGPAPARLEAAHLTHLLEALSASGEAAAALFSEKVPPPTPCTPPSPPPARHPIPTSHRHSVRWSMRT